MLSCEDVARLIRDALPGATVEVQNFGGGADHYEAVVVAPQFEGLTRVKQHQLVYAPIQPYMQNGTVHALGLKTYTPAQWEARQQEQHR